MIQFIICLTWALGLTLVIGHLGILIVLYRLRPEKKNINKALLTKEYKLTQVRMAKWYMKKNKPKVVERFCYDVHDYEVQFEPGSGLDRYMARIYMIMFLKFNW